MADATEWEADQERSWGAADQADEVGAGDVEVDLGRPADHVPQLHRAMSEAAADLDAVEDRLSTLFERTEGPGREAGVPRTAPAPLAVAEDDSDDDLFDLFDEVDDDRDIGGGGEAGDVGEAGDMDDLGRAAPVVTDRRAIIGEYEDDIGGAFAELDAELMAEEPDEPDRKEKRRRFGRRAKGRSAAQR